MANEISLFKNNCADNESSRSASLLQMPWAMLIPQRPVFSGFHIMEHEYNVKAIKYLEPGSVTGTLVLFILNLILHLSPSSEVMIQDFM